ncbi:grpb/dephospho-CoA kinase [Pterulicium gracile]|uniref:Grpb/dephospho-CoA kinase n=1 Tax=Pterulicium gracile TaxID=1884261 RepID=A0A5C3QCE8_9AGAR|nr:grpb/dephospho-CoA kinase [Pterula gracilis]
MLKINVVEYDPQWLTHFSQISSELDYALSNFLPREAYDIQHVGSTSVPGLAAKPIIDIDIIVPDSLIMEATQALTSHGYTYAYERGGIDRMVFRYNLHKLDSGGSTPTEDGSPRRAVYLNKSDGAALANHLAFRDVLRRDEGMRDEYGELKMALAKEEHADIGAYGAKKQAFIIRALHQSGLPEEKIDRIMARPTRRVDAKILQDLKRNQS